MTTLPDINKAEFSRFVQSRYPGARRNTMTGCFYVGAHEYRHDDLWGEAQAEKEEWLCGVAEKPEWIKK
jgi:hypothetical protein